MVNHKWSILVCLALIIFFIGFIGANVLHVGKCIAEYQHDRLQRMEEILDE